MSESYATESESSGPLRQVIGQWTVWLVAAIAVALSALMATRTEDTLFHEVWFGVMAVGAVLYALSNVESVSVLG
jgi:hypothetical protein